MFNNLSNRAAIASFISLLFASNSLAESVLAQFPSINPSSLKTNPPLCFIQTSSNKVLDLSSICGFRSPEVCNIVEEELSDKPSVLSEFCKKNQRCELTGTCDKQPPVLPSSTPQFQG
jgi:hypothetical protein